MTAWPGMLPRAGGLDDQDALLMAALDVLKIEDAAIREAFFKDHHG